MVKIALISDTHCLHEQLIIPEVDILIHAGDATNRSTLGELQSFACWIKEQTAKTKIYIAGNHDWACSDSHNPIIRNLFHPEIYLLNGNLLKVEGLTIFGTIIDSYASCPVGVDILVTHYPPHGILDEVPPYTRFNSSPEGLNLGSQTLFNEVVNRIKPHFHLFGHIHSSGGEIEVYKGITFINAAVLDDDYKLVRQPIILNIDPKI